MRKYVWKSFKKAKTLFKNIPNNIFIEITHKLERNFDSNKGLKIYKLYNQ